MNRQEPYIGMPIILGNYDDAPSSCCGQVEIQPRPANNAESDAMADRREQMQQQQMDRQADNQNNGQMNQQRQPMVVAMAYVPWQRWQEPYPLDKGLQTGTIFPDLDLPFLGYQQGGMRR